MKWGFLCVSLRQNVYCINIMSTIQIKAEVLPEEEENNWYTADYDWPLSWTELNESPMNWWFQSRSQADGVIEQREILMLLMVKTKQNKNQWKNNKQLGCNDHRIRPNYQLGKVLQRKVTLGPGEISMSQLLLFQKEIAHLRNSMFFVTKANISRIYTIPQ